jgi:hypothetical protein
MNKQDIEKYGDLSSGALRFRASLVARWAAS